MTADLKAALLVVTNRVFCDAVRTRIEGEQWAVTVVDRALELKEELARFKGFDVAYLDVPLSPDAASKLLAYICKVLPPRCRIVVAAHFLDQAALAAATRGRTVTRLEEQVDQPVELAVRLIELGSSLAGPRYDANIINIFVTCANEVLEYYVGTKATPGKPTVAMSKRVPPGFVVAVVRFTGSAGGSASLTCEKDFIVEIASRVNGTQAKEVEGDAAALLSTLDDLADQIFGKAELLLNNIGYELAMGRPAASMGDGKAVELTGTGPVVIIPFTMSGKRFSVGFVLDSR